MLGRTGMTGAGLTWLTGLTEAGLTGERLTGTGERLGLARRRLPGECVRSEALARLGLARLWLARLWRYRRRVEAAQLARVLSVPVGVAAPRIRLALAGVARLLLTWLLLTWLGLARVTAAIQARAVHARAGAVER